MFSKSRTSPIYVAASMCARTRVRVWPCTPFVQAHSHPSRRRDIIGRRCDFFRSRRRRRATRQLRCGGLSGAHKCTFVHLCCTFITCSCTINIGENNALLCINMCQKYHPTRMSNCAQFVMRSRSSSITTTHYKYNL